MLQSPPLLRYLNIQPTTNLERRVSCPQVQSQQQQPKTVAPISKPYDKVDTTSQKDHRLSLSQEIQNVKLRPTKQDMDSQMINPQTKCEPWVWDNIYYSKVQDASDVLTLIGHCGVFLVRPQSTGVSLKNYVLSLYTSTGVKKYKINRLDSQEYSLKPDEGPCFSSIPELCLYYRENPLPTQNIFEQNYLKYPYTFDKQNNWDDESF
ncbi:unnamed protein product [Didymodactylos carnosus]|uniref:SH2 domain-containing protein n=1 Tax=Didymodactylos carnosus TaxID=1234261 RepID=A0A8S2GY29_9BILA|nr:unnamed protein product [Didymodactylos carnosus]CAF3576253.1 unnamed protein product [Didymodactylos carnosus]